MGKVLKDRGRKLIEIEKNAKELGDFFAKMTEEEIIKSIREMRESR